jgi:hypothetical protein
VKLVCIADAHVHPWRLQSRDGGHDRLMDGLGVIAQSLDLAKSLDAAWVFAGDMKQPKTFWPQGALTGLHAIFRDFPDVKKIMVAGNHDAFVDASSGLAPFKDCATVIEHPQIVWLHDHEIPLVCCPWNGQPGEAAALLAKQSPRFLIAHGFLQGCMLGPEQTRIAKGIPIESFGEFDFAVFGDVHKAQWRVPAAPDKGRPATWVEFPAEKTVIPRGSVLYCGSPYMQNWGERNDAQKGALVIDLSDQTAELVPLKAPKYVHLDLDYDKADSVVNMDPDNFYRVVYHGALCSATDKIRALGATCRSFQFIHRAEISPAKRVEVHAGMSMRDMMTGYMASRASACEQTKLLEAGLRLAGVTE